MYLEWWMGIYPWIYPSAEWANWDPQVIGNNIHFIKAKESRGIMRQMALEYSE